MSYLLEAKKKAEKDYAKQQEKERKDQRKQAQEDAKNLKKLNRQKAEKANDAAKEKQKKASEAARELEEKQVLAAIKKSKAEAAQKQAAAAKKHAAEEAVRLAEVKKTRDALFSSDYDYEDAATLGVVIQSTTPKQNMQFQAVGGHEPPAKKRMSLSVSADDVWSDMSINCTYVGTFEVGAALKIDKQEVKNGIHTMKDYLQNERPATLIICLEGIKIIDTTSDKVAMAHALSRVSMAAADSRLPLFGFVAKNPGTPQKYCHVFNMKSKSHADHLQGLVMKAFRIAYANEKVHENKVKKIPQQQQQQPQGDARPMGNRQWAKHNPISHGGGQQGRMGSGAQGKTPNPPRQQQQQRRPPPAAGRGAPPRANPNAARQPPATGQSYSQHVPGGRPPQQQQTPSLGPKPSAPPIVRPYQPPQQQGSDEAQYVTKEGNTLEDATWFQAGIPREIAMELLEMSDDGAFVVRDSSSQPGNYALTMKGDTLMNHFIVRKVAQGYVLGSESQGQSPFPDLTTLIKHYAKDKGCLPCCLQLDSANKIYTDNENCNEAEHSFIDPEYQDLVELMGGMKSK